MFLSILKSPLVLNFSIIDYQNRIPYQLMDIPDNSEDEENKDSDEIPLSQDIGLINTEGKNLLLDQSALVCNFKLKQ